MDLLARREHAASELRCKLQRRFQDESLLDEQLRRLADDKLQSDARFAEGYVRQRVQRGYGPLRLLAELRQRGVAGRDAAMALEVAGVDWCERASAALRKKFGHLPPLEQKEKARRIRFIQRRGFSADHYRALFRD
ncbi:MAG: regulatory protein RecX [Halioglobus sp.]|nr:regulatory protein RecX [Halioglobus sp.]